jgi:hypothetical protein
MQTELEHQDSLLHARTDWFLQSLVKIVNGSSLEFGLTLQVSGMLVSGSLVSHKTYFEGFAESFSNAFTGEPEDVEGTRKSLAMFGEIPPPTDDSEENQPLPQFIHLKNARFFNIGGKPIPGNAGVWWRGRICEVGGFCHGTLSTD